MRTGLILTTLCCLAVLHAAIADVWLPPWGEPLYDSTFINLSVSDSQTVVDVRTTTAVVKLASDDYILTYLRTVGRGVPDGDAEIQVSDSLCYCDYDSGRLEFRFVSHVALEETLKVSLQTRYTYPADDQGNVLHLLNVERRYVRFGGLWGEEGDSTEIPIPVYDHLPSYYRITADWDLLIRYHYGWDEGWNEEHQGRDVEMTSDEEFTDNTSVQIALLNRNGYEDTIGDFISYVITPETRTAVANLIWDEEDDIQLTAMEGSEARRYSLLADIQLEPELALDIAPMWLWFPNDQNENAAADLVGLRLSGAWGNDTVMWHEDTLQVHPGNIDGQTGFYIFVPYLYDPWLTPNHYWHWTEPHLRVQAEQDWTADSCRFILITAPLQTSSIRFTIPEGFGFADWSSPLDSVELGRREGGNYLTFFGNCREPGIARVVWGPQAAPPDALAPMDFGILSVNPNPFNASLTISYQLSVISQMNLSVYDLSGRMMKTLANGYQAAGSHTLVWNAPNAAAGEYVIVLTGGEGAVAAEKVVLLK
jgi:hypothetical protein